MATDLITFGVTANFAVVAIAAAVGAMVARRLNQPTVVAFLVAGLLLGPVAGIIRVGPVLAALGEFGIALLLFLVGLDLSLKEVRAVGPPAVVAAVGQLVGSAAGGYAVALLLGFDPATALFLAVALAFSSTVVVVKILVDLGDLERVYGRLAVGIFLVQDLFVVLILTTLPVIGNAAAGGGGGALALEIGGAVARTAVLVAATLLAARFVLPVALNAAAAHSGLMLLAGVSFLFLATVASGLLGVSVEVGAFAAGLGLGTTAFSKELRRGVAPLLDLFIALFFVSLAARIDLANALPLLPGAIAFSAFVLVGKAVILTLVLTARGFPREESFRTGITVGQVSEFSFVLAALALAEGLVAEDARDFVVLVGIITIAASSVLIWRSREAYRWLARSRIVRALPDGTRGVAAPEERPSGHVLVLGWDAVAEAAARALSERGERVFVVAAHPDVPAALPEGVDGMHAAPEDEHALEAAGIGDARLVIAHLDEPGLVRVLLRRKDLPPVVARAPTAGVARLLEAEGASAAASGPDIVAAEALAILSAAGVPSRG